MKIFLDSSDKQFNDEFLNWRENNSEGFIVTVRGNNTPMLHNANCSHLIWKSRPNYSMTKKMKVCSRDRQELENWVGENISKKIQLCSDCKL